MTETAEDRHSQLGQGIKVPDNYHFRKP